MKDTHIVYWEGPLPPKKLTKLKKNKSKKLDSWVLYAVYGSHPLYGNDVLLYIGMVDDVSTKTKRDVAVRLGEHDYWFDEEYFGESKVFVASIDERTFGGWKRFENEDIIRYSQPKDRKLIERIEALLIFAHQPAFNKRNRNSVSSVESLRIFNTGTKGQLSAEVSGLFHVGNPAYFQGDKGDN